MIRGAAACAVLLLAGGCATLPPAADSGDWPGRRAELQSLQSWALEGRAAVAAGAQGFSGGLAWRQEAAVADISLRGPMGGTALSIRLDGTAMTVTDKDGTSISGEDARAYVARQIGVELPVVELRYWLIGVPAPGIASRENLGADGRLATLEQAGWRLSYTRYQTAGRYSLPARIEIESDTARLRLVVSSWQLPP